MLGSKYENLVILRDNGFNVADFEVIQFEEVIENPKEIIKLINQNYNNGKEEFF